MYFARINVSCEVRNTSALSHLSKDLRSSCDFFRSFAFFSRFLSSFPWFFSWRLSAFFLFFATLAESTGCFFEVFFVLFAFFFLGFFFFFFFFFFFIT